MYPLCAFYGNRKCNRFASAGKQGMKIHTSHKKGQLCSKVIKKINNSDPLIVLEYWLPDLFPGHLIA